MLHDELRAIAILDGFTDEQVAELAAAGEEVTYEPGDRMFEEGRPAEHWPETGRARRFESRPLFRAQGILRLVRGPAGGWHCSD